MELEPGTYSVGELEENFALMGEIDIDGERRVAYAEGGVKQTEDSEVQNYLLMKPSDDEMVFEGETIWPTDYWARVRQNRRNKETPP
jgi:hypothetical protein|tara:strand:+ start:1736 stop:1996 length:261 start_codon:yes stop_codon:yes gene_type:complete